MQILSITKKTRSDEQVMHYYITVSLPGNY